MNPLAHVQWSIELEAVIRVVQTALTPAFLLVAVGSLLNVLTGRLSRIVDRSRHLEERHANVSGRALVNLVLELRLLEKRMRIVGRSILLSVLAAVCVCVMIGLLFLMGLTDYSAVGLVVGVFIVALVLLAAALVAFVREVSLATHAIKIPKEYLELPDSGD
ncbi:DUF2721 domain-containing protein [Sphingorhabdus sp.]|uniref:DUF2721 domain-containing protein n=1 Tax=Sphingorhabdus sp. TaxID=1902408 RepID=UPI0035B34BCC|nr:DUF2721 domain-containing protein [Sphingomonadaceae bacterium]